MSSGRPRRPSAVRPTSAGTLDERSLVRAARGGDERAFRALVEPHRRGLEVHCYRMLGSAHDAEDVAEETLLRAWRSLERLEPGPAVRPWLYRIATNACLDELERRPRRPEPVVAPYPDARLHELVPGVIDPGARYAEREAIDLGFLTALQRLPGRGRAVLLLRDVLGWTSAEVADLLGSTAEAVSDALPGARTVVDRALPKRPGPDAAGQCELLRRCVEAWERGDVATLVTLLRPELVLSRPPRPALAGAAAIGAVLGSVRAGLVPTPTRANGRPAVALRERSADGTSRPDRLLVLEVEGDRIGRLHAFEDPRLLAAFGA